MKTKIINRIISMLLVSAVFPAVAQTTDDLLQLSTHEIQSTARFSGLGGAFNALGGDFGSLSINPAGIGTYRSSEFTMTPVVTFNKATTDFRNQTFSDSRTRFGLSNLGYVGTVSAGTDKSVIFNLGIGFNKAANFYKSAPFKGLNSPNSVLKMFPQYADKLKLNPEYLDGKFQNILTEDWSTAIAKNIKMLWHDDQGYYQGGLQTGDLVDISGNNYQSGGTEEYVFSFGGNISNKFQFGITLGLQDLELINSLIYKENYLTTNKGPFRSSIREEYTRTKGFGVNTKLGVIFRPVEPLRIGLAVHTPTWYNMEREYNVFMEAVFWDDQESKDYVGSEETPTDLYKYRLQTPYRLEAGIAYIIGKIGLISVDYEFVGNNAMRIYDDIWEDKEYINVRNNGIKNNYRASSNVRLGAEINLPHGLMLRGGYNYFQSPYKDSNLDYTRYTYAGGIGYRSKHFLIDFTYSHNSGKYHFAPYYVNDYRVRDTDTNPDIAVETLNIGRFIATIGFKF
jgi:hypothetical protein